MLLEDPEFVVLLLRRQRVYAWAQDESNEQE
jgi:hypothetical protein